MKQNMIKAYYTQAFPKINISLKIGEKSGNLHTLQSRFCLVKNSLYDSILIAHTPFDSKLLARDDTYQFETTTYNKNINFYLYGEFDCKLQDNLIYKAYCSLLQHSKSTINKCSLHIIVDKNIPVGGGLGGGSANAAITLLILNEVLSLNHDINTLLLCAKTLGSDVAFFLMVYSQNNENIAPYFFSELTLHSKDLQEILTRFESQKTLYKDLAQSLQTKQKQSCVKFLSANVFGVGDKIEPFYEDLPHFLIHCNTISCNTSAVYREFENTKSNNMKNNIDLNLDSLTLLKNNNIEMLNDLYIPACNLYNLKPIEKQLCNRYNKVYFSGSGSSFFSIDKI